MPRSPALCVWLSAQPVRWKKGQCGGKPIAGLEEGDNAPFCFEVNRPAQLQRGSRCLHSPLFLQPVAYPPALTCVCYSGQVQVRHPFVFQALSRLVAIKSACQHLLSSFLCCVKWFLTSSMGYLLTPGPVGQPQGGSFTAPSSAGLQRERTMCGGGCPALCFSCSAVTWLKKAKM